MLRSFFSKRFVWIVLALALLLRVGVIFAAFFDAEPYSGDGAYYITVARQPAHLGFVSPTVAVASIGPLYPIVLIPSFKLIPDTAPVAQVVSVRLLQATLDTLTIALVYLIARRIFGEGVGRVVLVAQALDARYIFTAAVIATEVLFDLLFVAFMLLYLSASSQGKLRSYCLAGLLLGLATLTRPVALLFPLALLIHAWLHPENRRRALAGAAWLLGTMVLVIMPWMVRTAIVKGEILPIADTAFSHLWLSSIEGGRDLGEQAIYEAITDDVGQTEGLQGYKESSLAKAGIKRILSAPSAWLGRVAKGILDSYLQPYGTVLLVPRGDSARQVVQDFIQGEASLAEIFAIPGLWRRLLMYIWHYWGLLGGLAGLVLAWRERRWQILPLVLWIVYLTAVTSVLLIEPRYIFPLMFALAILASYATVRAWEAVQKIRLRQVAPEAP